MFLVSSLGYANFVKAQDSSNYTFNISFPYPSNGKTYDGNVPFEFYFGPQILNPATEIAETYAVNIYIHLDGSVY